VHKLLDTLAKGFAILGGLVMVALTLMTTGSVIGRYFFSKPLLGDTEATQFGMAIAVAAFLPICQWRLGNIIVDFFTTKTSDGTRRLLDGFGALLVSIMMGLLAWRLIYGAIGQKQAFSSTMLLGWPEWIAYAAMVPPMAVACVIGLYMTITGKHGRPDHALGQ
jgi:TRAP-type C4-dicarboxylate transport system permease small subunit